MDTPNTFVYIENAAKRPGRKNSTGSRMRGKMSRSESGNPILKKNEDGTLYQLFRASSAIERALFRVTRLRE